MKLYKNPQVMLSRNLPVQVPALAVDGALMTSSKRIRKGLAKTIWGLQKWFPVRQKQVRLMKLSKYLILNL